MKQNSPAMIHSFLFTLFLHFKKTHPHLYGNKVLKLLFIINGSNHSSYSEGMGTLIKYKF